MTSRIAPEHTRQATEAQTSSLLDALMRFEGKFMSFDRVVVFALLFLVVYFASAARLTYMTAYREEKLRLTRGMYLVTADHVLWEIVHLVKNAMVLIAVGQLVFTWVGIQPWFVR